MRSSNIIPAPREISIQGGTITLDSNWGIDDRSGHPDIGQRCAEELGISKDKRKPNVKLLREDGLKLEEYRLNIAREGVCITAASNNGFLHALRTIGQLRNGPLLPIGVVRDYPRLAMRGFHFMFESVRQLGAPEAAALINSAARLKLNTLLLEFGPRFPFQRHAAVRSPSALIGSELNQLLDLARSQGIQCIPLQQSLGHLNYLLRHDEYSHIREEEEVKAQMCPTNENSFRVFTELAEEVLSYFPDGRFMHIGADETRQLGVCPRCQEEEKRSGKGSLYVNYINKVCAWLIERGVKPILWDDILCRHPHILSELHQDACIMYWDYWTTQSPSPLIVARYNPDDLPGVVAYDARWQSDWKSELSEVTASAMKNFARPVDLEKRLGGDFSRVFGSYLGDELPKYVRAFPYLEYYLESGRQVIGAPAGSANTSDWLSLPDYPRYTHNIKAFAERSLEAGAEGIVTTAWYNFPYEALYPSLLATAQFAW
ncbi:family 20 glycosylhydrolase [Candidatus Poribacteria bacterium]